MPARSFAAILSLLLTINLAIAQQDSSQPTESVFSKNQPSTTKTSDKKSTTENAPAESESTTSFSSRSIGRTKKQSTGARVTRGPDTLPNDHGQIWRKYDISLYTSRLSSMEQPQQALVDWILRETGTEAWFSEPLGFFNANRNTLSVYHTPEMQKTIANLVDRFVDGKADSYSFGIKLVTVRSPNWRAKAYQMLQPVEVQTAGVEAWLLSKENAAVLLANLRKRTDYREHQSADMIIPNGQVGTLTIRRPQSYVKAVHQRQQSWPNYQMEMGQIEAGFSLQLSPLLSQDGKIVDAVIRCNIDQVERLLPVLIDMPADAMPRQRLQIQVPQVVSWRLHERFRWPRNQVLLISCGVIATPSSGRTSARSFSNSINTGAGRADGLLVIDCKGKSVKTAKTTRSASRNTFNRY